MSIEMPGMHVGPERINGPWVYGPIYGPKFYRPTKAVARIDFPEFLCLVYLLSWRRMTHYFKLHFSSKGKPHQEEIR